MNFHIYIQEVNNCLNYKNGNDLALLLSYQDKDHSQSSRLLNAFSEETIAKNINMPWNDICIYHLNVCYHISQLKFIAAYKEQANLIQYFTKAISSMNNENWMCPVLNVLIRDLRLLAIAADLEISLQTKNDFKKQLAQKPHIHNHLETAADNIMGLFRITATDLRSAEQSKRKSMINVINQLFKIYFKINKLHLCKPLVRALENNKNTQLVFGLAERVTYNYFLGMRYMFDSDYRNADELLSFSFRNCHTSSFKNKRLILIFLIPVKMLLGFMPTIELLQEFNLMHFEDVVNAVKQGNLRLLDKALEQNSEFFWKYGIYLILEKLKIIAYRNVFKKVVLISKTHQIPITQFQIALNFLQDEETTIEEVHCILANLISDGKIKGYISLQHQKLVVSKQTPFPKLSTTV